MQTTTGENHTGPVTVPTRHDDFYLSDQLSVFQVEGKLYKVHRHFLVEHSSAFRDMFALPAPAASSTAGGIEGDSDEHPIHLSGVTGVEFESLMKVFYRSQRPDFSLSYSEWLSVLAIAHRFDFPLIHTRAVENLRCPPTAAEAIPLLSAAVRYGVDVSEIPEALKMVIQREQAIAIGEMQTLSIEILSQVVLARETWIRDKDTYNCNRCQDSLQPNRFRCGSCDMVTTNPAGGTNNASLLKNILKDVWHI
ncbi:hypothetical protein OF83DRAFT_1151259, partial [Amylostereum chailletii]